MATEQQKQQLRELVRTSSHWETRKEELLQTINNRLSMMTSNQQARFIKTLIGTNNVHYMMGLYTGQLIRRGMSFEEAIVVAEETILIERSIVLEFYMN